LFDLAWVWGGEALLVTPDEVDPSYRFKFPNPGTLRSSGPAIQLRDVYYKYRLVKMRKEEKKKKRRGSRLISPLLLSFPLRNSPKFILEKVTLSFALDCRVGFLGKNGSGKTTLLNVINICLLCLLLLRVPPLGVFRFSLALLLFLFLLLLFLFPILLICR
jgi:hypothetical protein